MLETSLSLYSEGSIRPGMIASGIGMGRPIQGGFGVVLWMLFRGCFM